jgi:hypothetical protein
MFPIMIAILTLVSPLQPASASDRTPIKGNAHLCPKNSKNDTLLHSKNSNVATQMKFINESQENMFTFWIDFSGDPVFYSAVESGSSVTQPTYVTHPWVIVRADMKCFGPFMPKRTVTTVIID